MFENDRENGVGCISIGAKYKDLLETATNHSFSDIVVMAVRVCLCSDELVRVKRLYQSLHQEMLPGHSREISST